MRVTYSDTTAVKLLLVHSGNGSLSLLRGTVGLHSKLRSDRILTHENNYTQQNRNLGIGQSHGPS